MVNCISANINVTEDDVISEFRLGRAYSDLPAADLGTCWTTTTTIRLSAKTSVAATDKSNLNPRASAFVGKQIIDPEQYYGYVSDKILNSTEPRSAL